MNVIKINNIESPGGLKRLEIYSINDVKNCPIHITETNFKKIIFLTKDDDMELHPISDMEIKEPSVLKDGGRFYNIKGGFVAKRQDPLIDKKFHSAVDVPVMVKAYFINGNERLYGSVVSPLVISFEPYNGKEMEQGSGYKIAISGKTTQKPIYLNG